MREEYFIEGLYVMYMEQKSDECNAEITRNREQRNASIYYKHYLIDINTSTSAYYLSIALKEKA